jgi:hypothetical protein
MLLCPATGNRSPCQTGWTERDMDKDEQEIRKPRNMLAPVTE